jgi:hypothetical protein
VGGGEEPMWYGGRGSAVGLGWGYGGFNTEGAEEEHRGYREEKDKAPASEGRRYKKRALA